MLTKSGFAKRAADKLILPKTGTQAAGGEFFNTIGAQADMPRLDLNFRGTAGMVVGMAHDPADGFFDLITPVCLEAGRIMEDESVEQALSCRSTQLTALCASTVCTNRGWTSSL